MNKNFIIGTFAAVVLAVTISLYTGIVYGSSNINTAIELSGSPTGHVATHINATTVTTTDGIRYTIDFGSQHSFLADTTVRRILKNPDTCPVPTLAYSVCPDCTGRLFDTKYAHQLTMADPEDGNIVSIRNTEFLSYPGCSENIIGMDILSQFIIEVLYDEQVFILHKTIPNGYIRLGSIIHKGSNLANGFMHGDSYYIDLTVDHRISESFHIDTGHEMTDMFLTMPASAADPDIQTDLTKTHECWVNIESRAGASSVNYTSLPNVEEFSVNPFTFFKQDFMIAFPDNEIYLRPTISDSQTVYSSRISIQSQNVS